MVLETVFSNPAVAPVVTVLGRNIYGWFVNSFKDGQIQSYEWKQLFETALKLGGLSVFAYFGINAVFQGISATDSTALVAAIDVLKSHFKKEKK